MLKEDSVQMNREDVRINRCKKYGVPYMFFGEDTGTQQEHDYLQAHDLIFRGQQLPKDLEKRLLQYKADGKTFPESKSRLEKVPW